MKELPIIGNIYNCFDDYKICENRRYEVVVKDIIPFDEADEDILKMWNSEIRCSCFLFDKTDYFIKADYVKMHTKDVYKDSFVFARTVQGFWFDLCDLTYSGILDVDGELNKKLEKQIEFEKIKIGQHLWVLMDGKLLVVAKFDDYKYQVCGDWETGIRPYECEIVKFIDLPDGFEGVEMYYNV